MKPTFYKMAFPRALVSGVALLTVIGYRPAGSRAQQPRYISRRPLKRRTIRQGQRNHIVRVEREEYSVCLDRSGPKGPCHCGAIVRMDGEEFCNANIGYASIGHIIALVSERPMADSMKEEVFRPLGMTGTVFNPDPTTQDNLAVKYDNQGGIAPSWGQFP